MAPSPSQCLIDAAGWGIVRSSKHLARPAAQSWRDHAEVPKGQCSGCHDPKPRKPDRPPKPFSGEVGQHKRTKEGLDMAMGRPTKYDPKFCDDVVEHMSLGFSRMASAGLIGVCYDTFREWVKEYPDFSAAVSLGMAKRLHFLETGLIMAESGPQVTSRIFALKNAAPEEWQDRKAVEVSGPGQGPIRTLDVSKLPNDAMEALLAARIENDDPADA